jgi:hypothetical protein
MKSKEQRTNEGLRKDVSMSIQEVAPEQLAQLFHHYIKR